MTSNKNFSKCNWQLFQLSNIIFNYFYYNIDSSSYYFCRYTLILHCLTVNCKKKKTF